MTITTAGILTCRRIELVNLTTSNEKINVNSTVLIMLRVTYNTKIININTVNLLNGMLFTNLAQSDKYSTPSWSD